MLKPNYFAIGLQNYKNYTVNSASARQKNKKTLKIKENGGFLLAQDYKKGCAKQF